MSLVRAERHRSERGFEQARRVVDRAGTAIVVSLGPERATGATRATGRSSKMHAVSFWMRPRGRKSLEAVRGIVAELGLDRD